MRALMLAMLVLCCTAAYSQTLTVTTLSNHGPGSLPEALVAAPTGSTIGFAPHVVGVIDLQLPLAVNLGARKITILGNVDAAGVPQVTLSGMRNGRMLRTSEDLTIINMNFVHGLVTDESGGAILSNGGTLTLINCHFTICHVRGLGVGGAVSAGEIVILDCSFNACASASRGGAIHGTTVHCERSLFRNGTSFLGGAFIWGMDVELHDCVFRSGGTNGVSNDGGAVHASTQLTAVACVFDRNSAVSGGTVGTARGRFIGCEFSENVVSRRGGAIHGVQIECVDCRFIRNDATDMGGAISGTLVTCTDCEFEGNTSRRGGAVAVEHFSVFDAIRCVFVENIAVFEGGAIFAENSQLTCTESTFNANEAGYGGAIFWNAMVVVRRFELESCTFHRNSASNWGGALSVAGQGASCVNCTFVDNGAGGTGGAMRINGGDTTVLNSTFSENGATTAGRSISLSGCIFSVGNSIFEDSAIGSMIEVLVNSTHTSLGFNIVTADQASMPWMNATGDQVATNPLLQPLSDNGGFVLTMAPSLGSPAINQGGPNSPATDARGVPRPFLTPGVAPAQGGNGSDIGAYEHAQNQAPVITAPATFSHVWTNVSPPVFTGANEIRIDDPDAGNNGIRVTLTVTTNTLTLASTAGLTFNQGSGTGDAVMDFIGSQHAINAALDGMGYNGTGTGVLTIDVDDLGNTGYGQALTATAQVNIDVTKPELEVSRGTVTLPSGAPDNLGQQTWAPIQLTYTLSNPGTADLEPGSVRFFNIVNCTLTVTTPAPATIAPTQSGQLVIEVEAISFGAFAFEMVLENSAPDTPAYQILVDGNVTQPYAEILRGSINILNGSTDTLAFIPTAGVALTYDVTNIGNDDLTIPLLTVSNQSNVTLNFLQMPANLLVPQAGTAFVIEVLPVQAGPYSFDVSLTTNAAGQNPYEFFVEGIAGDPDLELSRDSTIIALGGTDTMQPVTMTPVQVTYEITNVGNFDLNIGNVILENEVNGLFTVITQPPAVIPASQSAQFVLEIEPAALGPMSVDARFSHNMHGIPEFNFQIAADVNEVRMTVTRNSAPVADAGTVLLGTSPLRPVSITIGVENFGNIPLVLDAPQFANLVNCTVDALPSFPLSVAPATTELIEFTVTPIDLGPVSFDTALPNNSINTPAFSFHVTGQMAESRILVERDSQPVASGGTDDVGVHAVGSFTLTYMVSNTGNQPLTIGNVAVLNNIGCTVTISNPLPQSIGAGATAPLGLTVSPIIIGQFRFELALPNNSALHPGFTLRAQGNTGDPEIAVLVAGQPVVNGFELSFAHDGSHRDFQFTIHNNGARALELSTITFSNLVNCTADVVGTPAAVVSIGASTTLTIRVTPTGNTVALTLEIPNNDPANNPFIIHLSGKKPESESNDGGCAGGGGPVLPWALVVVLLALRFCRVRRVA